jgi:hypothetical protein
MPSIFARLLRCSQFLSAAWLGVAGSVWAMTLPEHPYPSSRRYGDRFLQLLHGRRPSAMHSEAALHRELRRFVRIM